MCFFKNNIKIGFQPMLATVLGASWVQKVGFITGWATCWLIFFEAHVAQLSTLDICFKNVLLSFAFSKIAFSRQKEEDKEIQLIKDNKEKVAQS